MFRSRALFFDWFVQTDSAVRYVSPSSVFHDGGEGHGRCTHVALRLCVGQMLMVMFTGPLVTTENKCRINNTIY